MPWRQPPLIQLGPTLGRQQHKDAARWGQQRENGSRHPGDEPQPAQADTLSGWFSIYCHTHPAGEHLGTRLWPPQLQAWGWKLLQSTPSCWTSGWDRFHMGGQGLDNHFQTTASGDVERVDLHARTHGAG